MDTADLPGIRTSVLLRLAWRGIVGHGVRSTITVVVVGLAVAAVVGTSGRTEATRRTLLAQLEDPSARLVRIVDRSGQADLSPSTISRLAAIRSVEWAVGLSAAGPLGRNPALGTARTGFASDAVGTRRYWGDLLGGPLIHQVSGRPPEPAEALVGERAHSALGLTDRAGTVDDEVGGPLAVVGSFAAIDPVENLSAYVMVRARDTEGPVSEIVVLIRSSAQVEPFVERLSGLLGTDQPVGVERAAELLALRAGLAAEVGDLDAAVLTGSLSSGGFLISAILFGAVEERRREFGLRRSQGATRSTIAALVLTESSVLALVGTVAGAIAGMLFVAAQTETVPDPALAAAVGALVILSAIAGSIPPAAMAALREPLYVLRSE